MFMYIVQLYVQATFQRDQECMRRTMIPKNILTPNLRFLPQILYRYARTEPEVKETVTRKHLVTRQGPRCIYIPNMILQGDLLWVQFSRTCS